MTMFRIISFAAALAVIASGCTLDPEGPAQTDSSAEAATQAKAAARLEAQAAAGSRDAQEVVQAIERFRRLHPELAVGILAPEERDAAIDTAMVKRQETGQLAVGTLCDSQWRTMVHGESSFKLKIRADGFAVVQPLWPGEEGRELFLFCRDDRWSGNHHLIWSNTGNYLTIRHGEATIRMVRVRTEGVDPPIGTTELFDIQNLDDDPSWSYFKAVVGAPSIGGFAQPDPMNSNVLFTTFLATLNGNALWRCTPGKCTSRFGR